MADEEQFVLPQYQALGGDATETTTITSYDADFVVDESGDLAVTETLTVDFDPSAGILTVA